MAVESAVRWMAVEDLPSTSCQAWRLSTNEDFELKVDGDFLVGGRTRTLSIEFDSVFALTAHDDMSGKTMTSASPLPKIETGNHAEHVFPMITILNSNWSKEMPAPTDHYQHYLFVSFTCSIEVLALSATAAWVD